MRLSKAIKPRVIILSGYGLNCEDETAFAFETAGAKADIVHINDVGKLDQYQILVVPGGFSFGDDTGSGKAFAHKLKAKLGDQLHEFLARDTLMAGICNGFQILTSAGILPGALTHNDSQRYISKWVEIERVGKSAWLEDIEKMQVPIAHGEGKFIKDGKIDVAFRYVENPNGSTDDIAGILGYDGRVLGMMPHPERAQFAWQRGGQGLQLFKNAIRYFK
ncbi:MAG: phosphoribosylformylglycinamidine synthase I [Patescibacteria group bacterium]